MLKETFNEAREGLKAASTRAKERPERPREEMNGKG